jgi:hypothetical protein
VTVELAPSVTAVSPTGPRGLRSALGVGLAVGLLLVGVGYVGVVRARAQHPRGPIANPLYLPWPARGSLRDDIAVIERAHHVWDYAGAPDREGPTRPHTDVQVLYAERLDVGVLVVLEGTDQVGVPELALLFLPPRVDGWWVPEGLYHVPMPDPVTTRHLAISILTNMAGDDERFVVIGEPGTTTIAFSMVPEPQTMRPMVVQDGVGVAPVNNDGIHQVVVANAGGTFYQGPVNGLTVGNSRVGFTPPA